MVSSSSSTTRYFLCSLSSYLSYYDAYLAKAFHVYNLTATNPIVIISAYSSFSRISTVSKIFPTIAYSTSYKSSLSSSYCTRSSFSLLGSSSPRFKALLSSAVHTSPSGSSSLTSYNSARCSLFTLTHAAAAVPPSPSSNSSYWAEHCDISTCNEEQIESWKTTFSNLTPYDTEGLKMWRKEFDLLDRDADGFISQADLQKSPKFNLEKIRLLSQYDRDQNNLIDFGEFVEAMYNVDMTSLRDTFEGFDSVDVQLEFDKYAVTEMESRQKSIPLDQIKHIMSDHEFMCVTTRDAERLFQEMDRNQDGVVDYEDFKEWLHHCK